MADPIRETLRTDEPTDVNATFKHDYSEGSGKSLAKFQDGDGVKCLLVNVTTAYTAGATITIGTAADPDKYATSAQIVPGTAGVKRIEILTEVEDDEEVILTLAGTAAAAGALHGLFEVVNEYAQRQ